MRFRDYFSIKQILFAIGVVALMMVFAFWQSGNVVEVSFYEGSVYVHSRKYTMDIVYSDIVSAEMGSWGEAGEAVADCYDDGTLLTGIWRNDTWGEYTACIDPDTDNCIVVRIQDGRTLVFSRKNDETTAGIFETLQTYLPRQ